MTLYELSADLKVIESAMEAHALENGGDVSEFPVSLLEKLEGDIEKKCLNVAAWVKNLKAESDALKVEKSRLDKRKRVVDNKIERLKSFVGEFAKGKISDSRAVISWRKSKRLEIPTHLPVDKLEFM